MSSVLLATTIFFQVCSAPFFLLISIRSLIDRFGGGVFCVRPVITRQGKSCHRSEINSVFVLLP